MAVGTNRNPLGMMLGDSILPGPISGFGGGTWNIDGTQATPVDRHNYAQTEQPKKAGFLAPGSKGQMIAGIIADALAGATGGQPMFGQMRMQERQREAEEAQWHKRRMAGREDKAWEWANKPKDDAIPPILRDAEAWQRMTPEQRAAYTELQRVRPQFIPDGLGGGQWASPAGMPAAPQPAIGAVVPDPRKTGGPTPQASGGFR